MKDQEHNLGAYAVDDDGGLVVYCRACARKLSRSGDMAGAELIERGGWLIDEHCDNCGDSD